jgi:two-component system response regulator FixJ
MAGERAVFVVDDDEAIRDSLDALLSAEGYSVRGFASARDFLENCDRRAVGCLLLDVNMPEMDGLALQERVVKDWPHLAVVVVTGHADVQIAVRAMKAGAIDFIEKPFDRTVLAEIVRQAVERSKTAAAERAQSDESLARLALLSTREREVLEGLVAGLPNKTIAYDLEISPRTVEIYRARLMDKMQAKSLPELVRMAVAAGVKPR